MHIFLSYSSEDRNLADRIHLSLLAQHHDVFFDHEDLTPGSEYDNRIAQEIQRANLFIFLISPDSLCHGRYTLTELGMAQRKWTHPAGHVLPVMVRTTPIDQVPPYLKAITILQPTGDIPSEVADHVRRIKPPSPRWIRLALGLVALGILGFSVWGFSGLSSHVQQAIDHLQSARSLYAAGEPRSAFDKTLEAKAHLSQAPLGIIFQRRLADEITVQRIESATAWLGNMHAREGERFSDLAGQLLPTLDEAIAGSTGPRQADLLAYRGWADFLRSRDSGERFEPDKYYRQAISIDSNNVYAHAMWGHWIAWNRGTLHDMREHFTAALTSGRQRPYVRDVQFVALRNLNSDEGDGETLRVAHEMWSQKEPIPEDALGQIRSIYSSACGSAFSSNRAKLVGLSELEHVALIRDLFFHTESSRHQSYWTQPCLARLQESAGLKADAIATYRAIQAAYKPSEQYWTFANDAIKRLSQPTSKAR